MTKIKVPYSDLFDYYPLTGSVYFNGYYARFISDVFTNEYTTNYNDLKNFFRIPVDKNQYIEVSADDIGVVSNEENRYYFHRINVVSPQPAFDVLCMQYCSTPDYILLYFRNSNATESSNIDCSLIPGGYGIYRIPYKADAEHTDDFTSSTAKLYTDEITNIYKLSENVSYIDVCYNSDNDKLFVFTEEGEKYYLSIVDPHTGKELQKTILLDNIQYRVDISTQVSFYDNFCILRMGYAKEHIMVFAENENGSYEKAADFLLTDQQYSLLAENLVWANSNIVAYRDGKLAMLFSSLEPGYDVLNNEDEMIYSCVNCTLVVFTEDELSFVGKIDNSLCEAYYNHYFNSNTIANVPTVYYEMTWK